jgi:hypothetical protein
MSSDMRHEKTIVFEERISVFRLDAVMVRGMMEIRELPASGPLRGTAGQITGDWGESIGVLTGMQCDRSGRDSGNLSLSQSGDAHAAGAESEWFIRTMKMRRTHECSSNPPRASMKNRSGVIA